MEHPLYYLWYGPINKLKNLWRHRVKRLCFRMRHGFWPNECWNLDVTFAKFILPRLKHYRDYTYAYPYPLTEDEWDECLLRMIETFEWIASPEYYDCDQEKTEQAQKDLELFAKYYMGLWD